MNIQASECPFVTCWFIKKTFSSNIINTGMHPYEVHHHLDTGLIGAIQFRMEIWFVLKLNKKESLRAQKSKTMKLCCVLIDSANISCSESYDVTSVAVDDPILKCCYFRNSISVRSYSKLNRQTHNRPD